MTQVRECSHKRHYFSQLRHNVCPRGEQTLEFVHRYSGKKVLESKRHSLTHSSQVRLSSALEDLKTLDLPRNLNIETEYKRFDPHNKDDPLTRGRTAFPGTYVWVCVGVCVCGGCDVGGCGCVTWVGV